VVVVEWRLRGLQASVRSGGSMDAISAGAAVTLTVAWQTLSAARFAEAGAPGDPAQASPRSGSSPCAARADVDTIRASREWKAHSLRFPLATEEYS